MLMTMCVFRSLLYFQVPSDMQFLEIRQAHKLLYVELFTLWWGPESARIGWWLDWCVLNINWVHYCPPPPPFFHPSLLSLVSPLGVYRTWLATYKEEARELSRRVCCNGKARSKRASPRFGQVCELADSTECESTWLAVCWRNISNKNLIPKVWHWRVSSGLVELFLLYLSELQLLQRCTIDGVWQAADMVDKLRGHVMHPAFTVDTFTFDNFIVNEVSCCTETWAKKWVCIR